MSEKTTDVWMPLWIGDYLADTQHLTRSEHGAYFLILLAYWRNGGPLPDDDKRLAAIAKATPREWQVLRPTIAEFFTVGDGVWKQKRADEEIKSSQTRKDKATEKAKAAAQARYKQSTSTAPSTAPSTASSNPQAMLEQCPSPSPSPVKEKNITTLSGKPDDTPQVHKRINGHRQDCVAILDFLNVKQGSSYRPIDANLKLIAARLNEGYEVQDFKSVIARKINEWGGTDMAKFIRPKTLFNATNFANYVGELGTELRPHKDKP